MKDALSIAPLNARSACNFPREAAISFSCPRQTAYRIVHRIALNGDEITTFQGSMEKSETGDGANGEFAQDDTIDGHIAAGDIVENTFQGEEDFAEEE
jgi:hypothetical protein